MEQASKADRYKSLMVDCVIILEIAILLMINPFYPVKFIALVIPVLYFPLLHALLSRSIGDLVFKLKIVDRQGNKIGYRLALNRFIWVLKCSAFASIFTNLLFMFLIFFSDALNNMRDVSFDYEGESGTFLVKEG